MEPNTRGTRSPLQDPRISPEFVAELYPTADGKPAPPPDAAGTNDEMVRAFVAAYYQINREYLRLEEIRKSTQGDERETLEKAGLQAVEWALRTRDGLEDEYAPYGVIAEPVMKDGLVHDLRFSFGNVTGGDMSRSKPIISSAFFTLPWPSMSDTLSSGDDPLPPVGPK